MMEAGNECSLGGVVIIVAAFRTTNYGETDISRWRFKHAGVGAEGQSNKVAVCASLPTRDKHFLAYCLSRIFTFLRGFFLSFLNAKSDTFISVGIRVNTISVITFVKYILFRIKQDASKHLRLFNVCWTVHHCYN